MSEHYTIQTNQGLRQGPMTFEELAELVHQGKIKPMTMVLADSAGRWQAAASIPEIRSLIKRLHPSQALFLKGKTQGIVQKLGKRASEFISLTKPKTATQKSSLPPYFKKEIKTEEEQDDGRELYTVRSGDGMEYGPVSLDEVIKLVKLGKVKATTMILQKSSKRWHLAASIPEIRALVRKFNPGQDSILDRIRAMDHTHVDGRRSSTVRVKIRQPFWRKFFT